MNAAQKRSLRSACLAGLLAAGVLLLLARPRAALFVLLADLGGLILLPRTIDAPRSMAIVAAATLRASRSLTGRPLNADAIAAEAAGAVFVAVNTDADQLQAIAGSAVLAVESLSSPEFVDFVASYRG